MRKFYTKELLYREIENLRRHIGITKNSYPLDVVRLCQRDGNIGIGFHPFETLGLRGILVTDGKDSAILLDSRQSREEQNFFCAHELIHSAIHRDLGMKQFNCYERTQPQQDSAIEWQANEGAAELLVPYKLFIPRFVELLNTQTKNPSIAYCIRTRLADEFSVSYQVIYNRIENLGYEISQYEQGADLNRIQLLSKRKQDQFGIVCPDYNAMCEFEIHFA